MKYLDFSTQETIQSKPVQCLSVITMLGKVKGARFLKISRFYYWSLKIELTFGAS